MLTQLFRHVHESDHRQHRHVAVIERGGAILAVAANKKNKHAEVRALKKAGDVVGARAWSMRLTKGGRLGMAKPCPACEKALREAGVKSVVYTTELGTVKMKLRDYVP